MFFTQINQMMNQSVDITLVIRKKEGQLMVSAMPKLNGLKDEAQNHIVPLTVTGTPGELDMGFIQTICRPMQKVAGLLTNMNLFEQQADKAAANSKAVKEQKDKEAKEAKEKKEKFDKHMKSATDFEAEKKYTEALASLQQARNFAVPGGLKPVDEKITAIKIKMGQGSLFGMEAIPQPQPQSQAQPVQDNTARQNGQPPVMASQPMQPQQPMNGNAIPNGCGPVQQPVYENGQNTGQSYGQPQAYPGQYGSYPYNNQPVTEAIPETEPELVTIADYSAHREGEYDKYPDFPGYSNNNMYNPQNL